MFFYATKHRFKFTLQLHNLGQTNPINPVWLEQAAKWSENKWGYLRNFPGIEKRKELIEEMKDDFYIITYANQPIATFVLKDANIPDTKKLTYVYVDESFRGLGIGVQLVEFAKDVCRQQGAQMIVLDTLTPNLDRFYEQRGAKLVCEDRALGHPTSLFRMSI
ncbi:MAG: GNAT family N-acetyltransferase [Proteobacteria bacterium]|nr:GNAT family N-acetyltransferase [Pseudomonadota bacterium]